MRRNALLPILLGVVLVAGCAQEPASGPTFETGDDDDLRVSDPGSGGRADNRTRLWEHKIVWTLESAPAPTTMTLPANVTDLVVRHSNTAAPCGSNVGDPTDPLSPSADFVSPSGNVTQVSLFANDCNAGGVVVYSGSFDTNLAVEVGTWQVTFRGRGANLEQTLVVEGERVL